MLTNFKRIAKFAMDDFSRNKGISVAAVFVLTITIMLVTGLFFFQVAGNYLTSQIQSKIDITAYFNSDAQESDILNAKDEIAKISGVKNIEYVSQDQALATFNQLHKGNSVLSQALQQVGDNPFLPALNITTNGDPAQYQTIANVLQTSDYSKLVSKVDFSQKKDIIEKVYSMISSINLVGIILGIILIIVAILVVYNTVKLAIENSSEEISTMHAVGADSWFIRGPFVIQGIIYGLIAFAICFVVTAISAFLVSSKLAAILPGFSASGYFLTNWWIFVLIQLVFGMGVGAISALIVVKKHLDK